jgi:16S rRNA (cytosine967-C5)-methyltransferase
MTPGARIQSSIELLDSILLSWQSEKRIPADKLIDNYFKARRFIGSKDRAAIGELVYWVLRHKAALQWWLIDRLKGNLHARGMVLTALMLRKEYTMPELAGLTQDSQYSLPSLTDPERLRCDQLYKEAIDHPDMPDHVRLNYPQWLDVKLHESFGPEFEQEVAALNEQAHTDLRVNTLKTTREKLLTNLQAEGFDVSPTAVSPIGIRLAKRAPIFTSQYFKAGHFEVQDEGSQLVAHIVGAKAGMKVIDFCAGAGGKTLAMAASMNNKGRILAWDNSEKRLKQIKERIKRAGVDNVQVHTIEGENDQFIKRHKLSADRVLVDAPCSGSGTWRRNPDLKWRFTPTDLQEVLVIQSAILESAARLVKPGGYLIYATCSLLKDENERQVEKFLTNINNFRVVSLAEIWDKTRPSKGPEMSPFLRVTPHKDGVDGFFAAVLERIKN